MCLSVAYLEAIVILHLALLGILPNPPLLLYNSYCSGFIASPPPPKKKKKYEAKLRKGDWVKKWTQKE